MGSNQKENMNIVAINTDNSEVSDDGEVSEAEVNKDYFFNVNEANESTIAKVSS